MSISLQFSAWEPDIDLMIAKSSIQAHRTDEYDHCQFKLQMD